MPCAVSNTKMLHHLFRNSGCFSPFALCSFSPFAREGVFSALSMITHITLHYSILSIRELVFVYLHQQHMLHVLG